MKKAIIVLFILVLILLSQVPKSEGNVVIPEEAIRYRIIANSNTDADQMLKQEIKTAVDPLINQTMVESKTITEARENIQKIMPNIANTVGKYTPDYKINYGNNFFPVKEYKGVSYPAGNYESLVVTLGEGVGDNFWCVLFPPLCLVDNKKEDMSEVEYKLYVKELFKKF